MRPCSSYRILNNRTCDVDYYEEDTKFGWNEALKEFEQNLLKALGGK